MEPEKKVSVNHAISEAISKGADLYLLHNNFGTFSFHGKSGKERGDKTKRFSLLNQTKENETLGWILLWSVMKASNGGTLWDSIGKQIVDHPTFSYNYSNRAKNYRDCGENPNRTEIIKAMITEGLDFAIEKS